MQSKKSESKFFNTIFIYFLMAIIGAFLFLLLTNTYYIREIQKQTESQYAHKLESLSDSLTATFEELHYSTAMFALTESVQDVLTSRQSYKNSDYTVISDVKEAIAKFYRTKSFIQSVFIISEEDNLVISNVGTGKIDEYLSVLSSYSDYPEDYWRSIGFQGRKYTILRPTVATNTVQNISVNVVPIIQHAADDLIFTDPMIINIEQTYIEGLLEETKLSDNSAVFLYNENGDILAATQTYQALGMTDLEMVDLTTNTLNKGSGVYKIDGKRYLIVAHEAHLSTNTVCAITPYSDLLSQSMSVLTVPMLIFMVGIVVVTAISFQFSSRIYRPIHNVALRLRESYMDGNEVAINNDLDFLSQNVQGIVTELMRLKEDLSLAIPYVVERYLISLFDDNEILKEEEVTAFLAQHDFSFPNKNFIAVHSVLNFQDDFFNTHSKTEFNAICQSSLLIANEFFAAIKDRYIFSIAANQICVILNLPESYSRDEISNSILNYHNSLDIDEEMMIVHSGVGQLYEGLNGLKTSYNEAIHASAQLTYTTTSMVRTYSPTENQVSSSHYTIGEENQMINYLLQGDKDKALEHYRGIIKKNVDSRISEHSLKELYLQLYNTAVRVINRRHMNIYDLMGESHINISAQVGDMHIDVLDQYMALVFDKTLNATAKNNSINDINNIQQYLEAHYTEELYLDSLAETFGKSANYLSKYIKKNLGVSFQAYISTLRIEKAKELLSTSNKSVIAIAEEVGFNSRHPFIRKFKILEGVTPSEFRKLHKNKV